MKIRLLYIIVLLIIHLAVCPAYEAKWKRVFLADSLTPIVLKFTDTAHGYCFGIRPISRRLTKIYGYRTSDGGKSWYQMNFTGLARDSFVHYPIEKSFIYPLAGPTSNNEAIGKGHYSKLMFSASPRNLLISFNDFFDHTHESTNTHFLITDDGGSTWRKFIPDSLYHFGSDKLIAQFSVKELLKFRTDLTGSNWGPSDGSSFLAAQTVTKLGLWMSFDSGRTFPYRRFDPIFYTSICDTSNGIIRIKPNAQSIFFDWSTPFKLITTYTYVDTTVLPKRIALVSLTSSSGGAGWKSSLYYPGWESINGKLESGGYTNLAIFPHCIKHTDVVYLPLHRTGDWPAQNIGRICPYDIKPSWEAAPDYLDYQQWVNASPCFLYSSNFGDSWIPVYAFDGAAHRAFDAPADGNVWMTVTSSPQNIANKDAANRIVHTTDNGATWTIDDTTLRYFEQPLDGRILTFSDPRHGWLAAQTLDCDKTFIFSYEPDEVNTVEESIYTGNYGLHYTLHPHPVRQQAVLEVYKSFQITDIQAYSILGIEQPLSYHHDGSRAEIDVRSLPIGHYTLRVRHNWGTSVIPLVVMR